MQKRKLVTHAADKAAGMFLNDIIGTEDRIKTVDPVFVKTKPEQIQNSEGAFVFEASLSQRVDRFLMMGSTGGTYYAGRDAVLTTAYNTIKEAMAVNPTFVIDRAVEISESGRAPKNGPAVFVLAVGAAWNDVSVRQYALNHVDRVCRIPTDLFEFLDYCKSFRGWGSTMRKAVAKRYEDTDIGKLAYHMVKYRQRNGWTHGDVLRKAHPRTSNKQRQTLFRWATSNNFGKRLIVREDQHETKYPKLNRDALPEIVTAFEIVQMTDHKADILEIIKDLPITHEMIPNQWLKDREVWEALVRKMPMTALIRNLGKTSSLEMTNGDCDLVKYICKQLTDQTRISKARIHPASVLLASCLYENGRGMKGSLTWTPNSAIQEALEKALMLSFKYVQPTNKRICYGVDVSASMSWNHLLDNPATCTEVAGVLTLASATVEPNYKVFGFNHSIKELGIHPKLRLSQVLKIIRSHNFGATDPSALFQHALKRDLGFDAFYILTDNEVNGGDHVYRALQHYRDQMGIKDCKLIVSGLALNNFSVADPNDPLQLDIAGFDANTPAIVSEFIRMTG